MAASRGWLGSGPLLLVHDGIQPVDDVQQELLHVHLHAGCMVGMGMMYSRNFSMSAAAKRHRGKPRCGWGTGMMCTSAVRLGTWACMPSPVGPAHLLGVDTAASDHHHRSPAPLLCAVPTGLPSRSSQQPQQGTPPQHWGRTHPHPILPCCPTVPSAPRLPQGCAPFPIPIPILDSKAACFAQ